MFHETDYGKLEQIMAESSEKRELLTKLLDSHRQETSSLSHEIRNPLTLVYSTLQLIEAQHPEVHNFEHWDSLRHDVEYMLRLLNELSSYNNSGRLRLAALHTETFLKTLALSFAASLADTDISFTSRIEPNLPVIQADEVKLREILLNLLGNARDALCKTVFSGTGEPSIRFSARQGTSTSSGGANCLIITMSDNGHGISPENMAHIFEPFVTHKENGTGLGLAISARMAKAHGGNLTASSRPGVLTVFTLTLPLPPI